MKPKQHGGKRKNSGRPALGRKPYLIRMKPKTKSNLDTLAGKHTVGEFLDEKFGSGRNVNFCNTPPPV